MRGKVTIRTVFRGHATTFEERGEPKWNRTGVFLSFYALPLGQTGSGGGRLDQDPCVRSGGTMEGTTEGTMTGTMTGIYGGHCGGITEALMKALWRPIWRAI